jgi:hypothetical protein
MDQVVALALREFERLTSAGGPFSGLTGTRPQPEYFPTSIV